MFCLQCLSSSERLERHLDDCKVVNGTQALKMTKVTNFVKFENLHRQLPVPFVIHADFEAITEELEETEDSTESAKAEEYQRRKGCYYCYKVVFCYDDKYV